MIELLHGGMLIPTSVSVCCAVTAPPPGRGVRIIVSVSMLLAMAESMSASPAVPAVVWAAVLLLLAFVTSAATSIAARGRRTCGSGVMAAHRGIGLVLMSALLMIGKSTGASAPGQHSHGGGGILTMIVVVGTAALVLLAVIAIRSERPRNSAPIGWWLSRSTLDISAMTAATSLMTLAVLMHEVLPMS